jgi:hypothetical protein
MRQMKLNFNRMLGWTQEATERFELFAETIKRLEDTLCEKTLLIQDLQNQLEAQTGTVRYLETTVMKLEGFLKGELVHHVNGHAKIIKALVKEMDVVSNARKKKQAAAAGHREQKEASQRHIKKIKADSA